MRILFVLVLVTAVLTPTKTEDSYLTVKTSNGDVKGFLTKSCRNGKEFVGFRGIPYAEPPVGELRFRSPVPRQAWEGVWDATFERPSCIQSEESAHTGQKILSEDCLYLNVYTPNIKYLKRGWGGLFQGLKAVMVFIHPGAFNTGGSTESMFSPDFLIDQDVVVVTFNYRLGALGFLSLQNEDVPGNAGLKDQNLVLKWVKKNIVHFGGDPTKITIFGESAGAASVNYHIISKASEGLFRSAIMQSGSVLSSWAYSDPQLALRKALNLARKVGCESKDLKKVLNCMQKVSAETLAKHQNKALTLKELLSLKIIAFHPTTEPKVPNAFLTDHPLSILYFGNFTKVPVIIGLNEDEGLLVYPTLTTLDPHGYLLTLIGMDLSRFVPYIFHVKPFTKAAIHVHCQISKFYLNPGIPTKDQMKELLELLSDVMFTLPIQLTASLLANTSTPVYNYFFTYDGGYNVVKAVQHIMKVPGVSHGDDLGYLFYTPALHSECGKNPSKNSSDEIMVDRMTKMWANFAKTGNPTPRSDPDLQGKWEQFTSTKRNYLNIGKDLVPSDSLKLANMIFWENLTKTLFEINQPGSTKEAIDDLEVPDSTFPTESTLDFLKAVNFAK